MATTAGNKRRACSAADIAAEVRDRRPGIHVLPLHKLLYFIQAEHLAWHGTPAFSETIEAWELGPVVASLWRQEKYNTPKPDPAPVPVTVANIITNVIARLGHLSGQRLIDISHSEGPWAEVTHCGARTDSPRITHEALARYGAELPPDFAEARDHINRVRDDRPFVADDPDAIERFLAERRS